MIPWPGCGFGIGELARRSGVRQANIRYYEEIGLLPAPARRRNGHRCYGDDDVRRATLVRNCRDLGFSVSEARSLLTLAASQDRSCSEARELAGRHLAQVCQKIAELQALKRTLRRHIEDCEASCRDAPAPDCSIFKALSCEGAATGP